MVDLEGKFVKYHGYTIICKVLDVKALEGIENIISTSKTLKKYIVPTPYSSYHMTITGINKKNSDKILQEDLNTLIELCTKYATPMQVSVKDVYFGDTPGILLSVHPKTTVLRNLLMNSVGMKIKSYSYHITIGYKFREQIDVGDYEGYADDVTDIKKYIFSMFPTHYETISLDSAKVCEFNDMTKFTPLTKADL